MNFSKSFETFTKVRNKSNHKVRYVSICVNFQITCIFLLAMFKTSASKRFVKGQQPLFLASSRNTCGKIMLSGTLTVLYYCVIFIVCAYFTTVVSEHLLKPGGPSLSSFGVTLPLHVVHKLTFLATKFLTNTMVYLLLLKGI